MLKRLWCLIVGHQFMVKFVTRETMTVTDTLTGRPMIVPVYVTKPVRFCRCCGKPNKNYKAMVGDYDQRSNTRTD